MSASDAFETSLLGLIITNAAATNVGDAAGLLPSASAGSFFIGLHTASPGETGHQSTSACVYGGYARQAVARSTSGWTVTGNTADNDAAITFAAATSGAETATHFSMGSDLTGDGNLFLFGSLTAVLAISAGITPEFAIGALDVTLD